MESRKSYSPIIYLRNPERSFQGRDVTALLYLHKALHEAGFELARPTLQSPLERPRQTSTSIVFGSHLDDFPGASEADLLLLPSRPPLDDEPSFDKRALQRSRTFLEKSILEGLRTMLAYCSRREVRLADGADFTSICSRTHQRYRIFVNHRSDRMAEYLEGETRKVIANNTAGYVLFHPKLPLINRPLLAVFGMSGDDTIRLHWALGYGSNCAGLIRDMISGPTSESRVVIVEIEKDDHPFEPLHPLDIKLKRVEIVCDARYKL